jgi:hypothetical protein
MHWRYRLRKQQLLDECDVDPEVFRGGIERLAEFARPFADCLVRQEQRDHARTYLAGLVSDLKHKTAESIAYRHDQERHGLQHFVGSSTWDHRPLLRELASQVGREIGTPDGVIVFDPSGFAKKGRSSAGVQRQWLGRLGKVDNGQVGVFMAYASSANCHMIPISFVPHDPDHPAVFWSGKPHLSPEVDMSHKMSGRPSVVGRSSPPSEGGARSTRSPRSST